MSNVTIEDAKRHSVIACGVAALAGIALLLVQKTGERWVPEYADCAKLAAQTSLAAAALWIALAWLTCLLDAKR